MASSVAIPAPFFENEAAQLARHPAGFLLATWLPGSSSSAALRTVFERVLDVLHPLGYQKVLIDQRQIAPISDEDGAWYVVDWLPRAIDKGYRYGAIVSTSDLFTRLALHSMRQQAMQQSPLVYQWFDQEELAIDWLVAQP